MTVTPHRRDRIVMFCAATAVFVATFLFRFLTLEFMNDHFVHLSRGRQILLGEVPVRDFFDPGLFLQYYASAAALMLSGGTLFGEAILTVSLVALGGALTFLMAARLSASLSLGLLAAGAAISIGPRLYGYPKVFLFVLALACGWRYLPDRSTRRLFVMALVTAVAFLFRHDHGVYIGISMTGLIVLLDWGASSRAVSTFGRYLVFTALLLLPFGIFIQSTAGMVPYLRDSGPQMTELTTPVFVWPRFVAASEPVGSLSRPSEQRTHVRWADDVEDAVRLEREQRYALTKSARTDDVHTWSYALANNAPENIRALVGDPLVVDTNGVDRNASRIPTESWGERTMRRFHSFTRATLTQDNALAWLYYATLLLPAVGALLLLIGWRSSQITRDEVALVGSLVLLCAVIEVTLVRGSPDSRLPDVAAPMAVLGAWVTSRWLKPRDPVTPASRSTGRVLAAAIGWLITLWSCASLANAALVQEAEALFLDPHSTLARLDATARTLHSRPIDAWAPPGSTGERALSRYIYQCTAPTDRVLAANFLPELNFYSERGFAGGQVYLLVGWHATMTDQQLTVARLERQRVPVMILDEASQDATWAHFPLVAAHVREHYTVAATSTFGGDRVYVVYVNRDLSPTGNYEPLGLPCFG
jgi:hypothetical protein